MMRRSLGKLIDFLREADIACDSKLSLSAKQRGELADWLEAEHLPAKKTSAQKKSAPPKAGSGAADAGKREAGKPRSSSAKRSRVQLNCDGASRGNPGPAAYGFVIYESGEELHVGGETLGTMTNNQAEYHGLLAGLDAVFSLGFSRVDVALDSELIVRQLGGQYKVKSALLKPLYDKAVRSLARFAESKVRHIPRAQNARADALANEALDSL